MTEEEKDLLLKDICARLPYDVKVDCNDKVYNFAGIHSFNICVLSDDNEDNAFTTAGIKYIKPYLFPLSSMTEEQKEEYYHIVNYISSDDTKTWMEGEFIYVGTTQFLRLIDFYHRNHLDYRGLINGGLAIDATGLNIY